MKIIKRIGITVGILVLILAVILAALYPLTRLVYRDFFKNAEKEIKIPGLSEDFIPQGLDYVEEAGVTLTCGYMKNKSASRVYVIQENGETRKIELKNPDGSDYTGHTGGLAHYRGHLYITGDDGLDVFSLGEILAETESAVCKGKIKTGLDPAYCHIENEILITGSFYRQGNYETPQNQRMTTPCGDENTAAAVIFSLSETAPFGVEPVPVGAISTRGLVQGMCLTNNGKIVLSTSYAIASSQLFFYDLTKAAQKTGTFDILGTEVPLIWLDGESLIQTIKAPPMAEEILSRNERIWIMTESASNTYIFGKFTGADTLYSYPEP